MLSLLLKASIVGSPLGAIAHRIRWVAKSLARHRRPELWEVYLEETRLEPVLRKLLRPDSNVVDVGCHIGSFLSLISRICPNGSHIAIEASPEKAAWLVAKFPSAIIHSFAVGKENGSAIFFDDQQRPGFSRVGHEIKHARRIEVQVRTLDTLLAKVDCIDFMKIDIEGGELNALIGAVAVLSKYRPAILFECGATADLDAINVSRRQLFDFLTASLDYKIYTFGDFLFGKGELGYDEFRKCGIYPFRAFNFIAIHNRGPSTSHPMAGRA
jgi:FkbM family methyltransferase